MSPERIRWMMSGASIASRIVQATLPGLMGLFLGGLFLPPPMHSRISVDPSKEFAKKVVFQAKKSPNTPEDVREEVLRIVG